MVLQLTTRGNRHAILDEILTQSRYGVDTALLSYEYTKVKEGV